MLFLHKYEYLLNYYRGRTGISFVFVGMSLCHRIRFVDSTSFFQVLPAYSVGHLIGFIGYTIITDLYFLGPPVSGALLTSDYKWWIPALFSGVRFNQTSLSALIMFLVANCPAWYFSVRDHACALGEAQQRHRKSKRRVNRCVCAEVSGNTGQVIKFE